MNASTLLVLTGLLAGCGGTTAPEQSGDAGKGRDARHDSREDVARVDSSSHHGSSTHGDAGADATPLSPLCPAKPPTVGAACTNAGVTCEYGPLNYDVSCDMAFTCQGTWATFSFGGSCQPDGPNAAGCPATIAGPQDGGPCAMSGLRCEYPEGVCTCAVFFGANVGDAGPFWSCNPGAGCPMPRPRLGSPCTGQADCTYETCSFAEICEDGAWQGELEACAGAMGSVDAGK